jgi:hypothetical protein
LRKSDNRLLWLDLSIAFDYSNYTISSEPKPDTIPNLARGTSYGQTTPNAHKFFRFGGFYPNFKSGPNFTPPPVNAEEVGLTWSYDVISHNWYREPTETYTGLEWGASTVNPITNEGYFLGGGQGTWVLQNKGVSFFVDGMMILNMTDGTWGDNNKTVPGPGIQGAFLEYLPLGEKGVLVSFAGMNFPEGKAVNRSTDLSPVGPPNPRPSKTRPNLNHRLTQR